LFNEAESLLRQLHNDIDAQNLLLEKLKSTPESDQNEQTKALTVAIGVLQQKCDLQIGMVEAFGNFLKAGEDEHIIVLKKSKVANDVWFATIEKSNFHKHRLKFLNHQVSNMQHGGEEPTLKPFSIYFNVDNDLGLLAQIVVISICPFCSQGFKLAWDCKILFCKHAYHC
jgi:hypothetical protein